jgi:ribosomal protein S18 acetylase RimI-like enzyme
MASAENERAVHLYASLGFTEVGREREVAFMRGRFRDHVCFDMLEAEFRERYGAAGHGPAVRTSDEPPAADV